MVVSDFFTCNLGIVGAWSVTLIPKLEVDFRDIGIKKVGVSHAHQNACRRAINRAISSIRGCNMIQNVAFQLSVQHNRLLRMFQVSKLSHLKILNLSHNCVVTMEGLRELKLLTWLSLASNSIKGIECLSHNVRLEHLDLSDNAIPAVADISHLKNLKVWFTLMFLSG